MMEELVSRMASQLDAGNPFAVFCKPGSSTATGVFQKSGTNHAPMGKGFVFAPFAIGQTCFIPFSEADVIIADTRGLPAESPGRGEIDPFAKSNFEALVAKSMKAIEDGLFQKLVVSRSEDVPTAASAIAIYQRLLQAYPMAYRYCFFHPVAGLWMGATPEQLLRAYNGKIHTVALAGTQLYAEGQEAVWGEKEKQEQQFVTDYIVQSLGTHVGGISVTMPYTVRAGGIIHIKTDITGQLQGNLAEVIATLHPTPAVCGLPKQGAMDFILANEGYNRRYYSGYLGELDHDASEADLFVNLRCMELNEGCATLYIGCGITRDSDPEKEFMETVNKSMTIRKVL